MANCTYYPNSIRYEYDLLHFKQQYDWDCGLSCILMILSNHERNEFLKNFNVICKEENFGRSTWTIDLCYLLKRFKILHKYLTTTIGINPAFRDEQYYERILALDEKRIMEKFKTAKQNDIIIERKSVKNEYLINHLIYYGPIILLVSSSYLDCKKCKANKLANEFRSLFPLPAYKRKFIGHYIVLCGYDKNVGQFFYRDPDREVKDGYCVMSFEKMTEARTAFGTDEDMILIYNTEL